MRSPAGRKTRSGAGLRLNESSWRPICFILAGEGAILGVRVRGVLAISALAAARKTSAKRTPKGAETLRFLGSLMLSSLAFGGIVRKPAFARRLPDYGLAGQPSPCRGSRAGCALENTGDTPPLQRKPWQLRWNQSNDTSARTTSCNGDASYGDFASSACGACVLQSSLCVFF